MQRRRSLDDSSVLTPRVVAALAEAAPGAVVAVPRVDVEVVELADEVVAGPPMPPPHRMDPQRLHDSRISGLLPCP